jgi:hypothetical protein
MAKEIEIARMLRAATRGFVAGCRVQQLEAPAFGALVRAPIAVDMQVFGLIYDIRIDDDGLVRQLVTAENVSREVVLDNRERRIIPVELSVLTVGYEAQGRVRHLLPPRPPLSLDSIFLCAGAELTRFATAGRLGYFRHVLESPDVPLAELLAAHIQQVQEAQSDGGVWRHAAVRELIALLRDDYAVLMAVLGALNETLPSAQASRD